MVCGSAGIDILFRKTIYAVFELSSIIIIIIMRERERERERGGGILYTVAYTDTQRNYANYLIITIATTLTLGRSLKDFTKTKDTPTLKPPRSHGLHV